MTSGVRLTMKILALEFSSTERSVAVGLANRPGEFQELGPEEREHGGLGMKPFSMIDRALTQAGIRREEIERLAVGIGPGSYTGIRAALAMAQGWQLARNIEVVAVGGVECLAAQAAGQGLFGRLHFIIDAQRREFYLATYDLTADGPKIIAPLRLATFAEVSALDAKSEPLLGPDARKWFPSARDVYPHASTLARLAALKPPVPANEIEPIYLRETAFVKAAPPRMV